MISKAAASFWQRYERLPDHIQMLADKSYCLGLANPRPPSLRFKPFKRGDWSVRVGEHYRAIGYFVNEETFVWTWIGSHEDNNRL